MTSLSIWANLSREGKGGSEHRWWQRVVQNYYQNESYDSLIEHFIDKRSVDVYALKEGEEVATEIALSPDHEIANIEKCLEEDFDRIEVAYPEKDENMKIESELESELVKMRETPAFRQLSEYLES